jgi:SHS2 domain-containing protein
VTRAAAGHRSLPHTADARVEAWAPSREGCIAEAVAGTVEVFLDTVDARPTTVHAFRVDAGAAEDQLVSVLDEVVYLLDTTGRVPLATLVSTTDAGLDVRFETAEAASMAQVGAAPKAVSLHGLRFTGGSEGWSCRVTLDV